jgi:hypothetical protein
MPAYTEPRLGLGLVGLGLGLWTTDYMGGLPARRWRLV